VLEDRAGGVEVPVAVEHVGSGLLRAPGRRLVQVVAGVRGRMVDAGAGGDEVVDRGLLLDGEETSDVIEPQIRKRRFEVDGPVLHPVAVQHGEDALADRGHVGELLDVSELIDDPPTVDHHEARGVGLVPDEARRLLEHFRGPAIGLQIVLLDVLPGLGREDRLGGDLGSGRSRVDHEKKGEA